ncbi:permease-like cell division protein FtsX [Flavobacteriales bacterium]|jgi:cell division transport system permease protein|nr:cell division protein FtsX [Flavobacteriales bacterium]MDC3305672.1 permease-like cell division protein FtsX [Flavobacteriales bacterium]MDG1348575.1 permease-like cell division protein FtsX [Flavobacteriales bacterium]|tara:strand:+ start:5053 stop:5931 length:879 start_codon:yes stop_codon:yes gene_type:complete
MKSSNNTSLNRRILSSSASVVISLSLVLFVVGLLGLVLINAQRLSNYVKENVGFTIMLKEDVNEMEIIKFHKTLDAATFAKSSTFVSKEQATIDLQRDLGEDFVSFLGYSPLLPSIDVKLNAAYANTDSLAIITSEMSKNTAVHDIFYQESLINKLNSNVNRLSFFLLAFCILLFVIAFALINNTIRLSVYSKRFLIRTMRLVGATNSFIQKPFLIKGIYQGIYSSIFAIFMLIGSIQMVQSETASMLNITDLKIIGIIFLLIFISGFLLSWISTFFAVRKFIKQNESELYN